MYKASDASLIRDDLIMNILDLLNNSKIWGTRVKKNCQELFFSSGLSRIDYIIQNAMNSLVFQWSVRLK